VQLDLFPDEFADHAAVVNYLLSLAAPEDSDITLPSPSDESLNPGQAQIMHLAQTFLRSAVDEVTQAINATVVAHGEEAAETMRASIEARGTLEPDISGASLNRVVHSLVVHAARYLVHSSEFLQAVCARTRWAFENIPPNVLLALERYWGDAGGEDVAPLEIARACACMGRRGSGIRLSAAGMPPHEV
jgi:hypothetical protein